MFSVCLSWLVSLLLSHAKKQHQTITSERWFSSTFFVFSWLPGLSSPLFLSLLSPLAPPHLTLPFFGVCVLLVVVFLFCVGFVFLFLLCFRSHRMSPKGRVGPLSTLWPGVQKYFWKWLFWSIKLGVGEGGCLEVKSKTTNFAFVFAKGRSCFWDMFRQH